MPRSEAQTALEVSEAQWREMLEVNLNAGFKGSPGLVHRIALYNWLDAAS